MSSSSNIEDENGVSSNSSEVEENGALFLHKEEESSTNKNVHPTAFDWDDSKLIQVYDTAINKAKQGLLKKMESSEMKITSAEIKNVMSTDANGNGKKTKKKSKKKKNVSKNTVWKVGSACRAVYSEDGEEYEAIITEMLDSTSCIVKFIGYNNEEEVLVEDLAPSLGKEVVQVQIEDAQTCISSLEDEETDSDEQNEDSYPQMSNEAPRRSKKRKPKVIYPRSYVCQPTCCRSPIPPPPPPPPFQNEMVGSKNDSANAMMLSWYMCGYYTGYYQRCSEEQQKH